MRSLLIAFMLFGAAPRAGIHSCPPTGTHLPLIWKAEIGRLSFRSNLVFTSDYILLGSNGKHFLDYNIYDSQSGVYLLERKTGKIVRHFANDVLGDMDVTGVLLYNDRCYFGNDNEEFLCTDMQGHILWRKNVSGDIEHEPVLLNIKGRKLIVFATEAGEVRAIDPVNGSKVWAYYTPEFSGYREGDNRIFFKVKAFFTNTESFYTRPEIGDLNDDGVPDLTYNTYDGRLIAVSGSNGKLLWQLNRKNGRWLLPFVLQYQNNRPVITVIAEVTDADYKGSAFALVTLNRNGKEISREPLKSCKNESPTDSTRSRYYMPDSREGFSINTVRCEKDTVLVNVADSIFFISNGRKVRSIHLALPDKNKAYYLEYRDALLASTTFAMDGHPRCIGIMNQRLLYEDAPFTFDIISLDDGSLVRKITIPKGGEMPPQIADMDKDGSPELLINSDDGNLYCYRLKDN